MPINAKYQASFEAEFIYHITARTNNKELLFRTDENRIFFLNKFQKYISPFAETLVWTLLPNHVHFVIQIKSVQAITQYLQALTYDERTKVQEQFLDATDKKLEIEKLIERQFNSLFTSYTKAFNTFFNREGNLFNSPFRRCIVDTALHLTRLIVYVHANVLKHKIHNHFQTYKWSSYQAVISNQSTNIQRAFVLDWFGGKEAFMKTHIEQVEYYYAHELADDDE
jgi:putative transposase